MHEYSVVSALIEQCEKYAKESGCQKVLGVKVNIGVQSGVVPELLKSAFDMFKAQTVCESAILNIELVPVVVRCKACGCEFEPQEYCFLCPKCQCGETKLLSGKEMHLMSMEME